MDEPDLAHTMSDPPQLWRLQRGTAYGIREGRVMLDRRDRNPHTAAEFPSRPP
jgi:hypothetical protein